MPEIITIGETMIVFNALQVGPLRHVSEFRRSYAGAESNVAIGLARLGKSTGWISKLGEDEFGEYIYTMVKNEGVDVSRVIKDCSGKTGICIKEYCDGGRTIIHYYRLNSAASRIKPSDLDEEYLASAKLLHITGISLAISENSKRTIYRAVELARTNGVKVSFDPNIRLQLWNPKRAKKEICSVLGKVDLFFPGKREIELIFETKDPEIAIRRALDYGISQVAVKLGKEGALVGGNDYYYHIPGIPVQMIDEVGAGDGFVSGYLFGYLNKLSPIDCGKIGNAIGAIVTTSVGDVEALPSPAQLLLFMEKHSISLSRPLFINY